MLASQGHRTSWEKAGGKQRGTGVGADAPLYGTGKVLKSVYVSTQGRAAGYGQQTVAGVLVSGTGMRAKAGIHRGSWQRRYHRAPRPVQIRNDAE
nr:hypothetical protein [Arthrobacter globiformis]